MPAKTNLEFEALTITKYIIFLLFYTYCIKINAIELTLYVNNWLDEIPKSYTVHTDHYVYLEENLSTTLSDTLDSNSSFNAVRSGPKGSQTSVFTRGTNSNHTLVTINGSPITDHSSSNGLSDLGLIDVSFADRLHLIDGPMSTLYGANAVGGVIDIQTEKNYTNKILTVLGSRGETKVSLKNNFGENKKYNFGIYFDKTQGISVYPDGEEKDGLNLTSFDLGFTEKHNIIDYEVLYIRSNQKTDLDASGSDDLDYTGNTDFDFFQFNSNLKLPKGKINLIFDNNNWDREYKNGSETDNYVSKSSHFKSVYILSNNIINNVLGYDYRLISTNFENRGSYNSSVDKDADQYGLFNNADINLYKNFFLSGGYRIDNNSHFGNQNTYRLGASYKLKELNLFSSYSTGFKNPTLYEMFGADNFGYTGNPNLKPEKSFSYEVGLNYSDKILNTEVSLYNIDVKDMITYANSTYSNDLDDASTMQGLDLKLDLDLKNFFISNSYSHVHAVDSSDTWLKRRPHDLLNSSVKFFYKNLTFKPELIFYGKYSDTHSSTFQTIQIKERSLFNLNLNYENFDLEVNNIFDDTFERPHGYNQGGIEVKLAFKKNF